MNPGIPFSQVPEQKKTSVLQYVFLLMFLRRKKHLGVRPLEPLERMVADKVDVGDISWLPLGRDMAIDDATTHLTDELSASVGTEHVARPPSSKLENVLEQLQILTDAVDRIEARHISQVDGGVNGVDDNGIAGAGTTRGGSSEAAAIGVQNADTADSTGRPS